MTAAIPGVKTWEWRFWGKTLVGDGCWEWQGKLHPTGYGVFREAPRRDALAHRAVFVRWNGPIAADMCVCHRCDNRRCVRPDHLFLGTKADNTADMMSKGRQVTPWVRKTHCPAGHAYEGRNRVLTKAGHQACRACGLASVRARRAKAKLGGLS
jgi:hypothetical protein